MVSSKQLFSGENISCVRRGRTLFEKLSFALDSGDILQLCGDNGSGKTSLLRIMSGALSVYEGNILWQGNGFLENGIESHMERFSYLPSDDSYLKPLETVAENLQFWADIYEVDNKACAKAMRKMHITAIKDRAVRYLSAGQKRRLSLAIVFLKDVPLWLLDEPLNGLDASARELCLKSMQEHCAKGGAVVVASHYDINSAKTLNIGGKHNAWVYNAYKT